jgi:carboxypeptidase Q
LRACPSETKFGVGFLVSGHGICAFAPSREKNKKHMRIIYLFLVLLSTADFSAQSDIDKDRESLQVKALYDEVLTNGQCYNWLEHLCAYAGPRLSGSPAAAAAVEYTRQMLDTLGLDSVWLQPCVVPRWVRGEKEQARIVSSAMIGTQELRVVALGNSIGTGPDGLTAEVVEVQSIEQLQDMEDADVQGKIVFYNRAMDVTLRNTFHAYGRAVDQRGAGPVEAAKKGAVAAIVRSMTTELDDIPHTGATRISPDGFNIPSVAVSTNDAEILSRVLKQEAVSVHIRTMCKMLAPVISYNVIGQINGSERPDEIILVGGHLDAWDLGQGAHDDGAGCVQSMEVLRALKASGYIPRRTLRCVLFMNEENGLVGSKTYAAISNENGEFHVAAIESDAGGFNPRGFTCSAIKDRQEKYLASIASWWDVMDGNDLYLQPGGSGADINALKSQGGILFGLRPDSQRYFDYHHTAADRIEAVNARELKMGAAAMTSLVYMLDKFIERVN